MSFLSSIAPIIGDIAAPFTGGASALIGNAVGGIGSALAGPQSPQNTGVDPATSQAISGNINNQSILASLLGNNLTQNALPLQNQVGSFFGSGLGGINPSALQSLLAGITNQTLNPQLQALISAMNPQTNITQEQGALGDQLQTAYSQASQGAGGKFGGTLPGEGPLGSLGQSYLQDTATAGANLQSQIAAQQAQAAQNQFGATIQGLNQQQGSSAQGLQSLLSILTGGQNAANNTLTNPYTIGSLFGNSLGGLNQLASGQANAQTQYNQGLGALGYNLGNLFGTGGSLSNLFGGGNNAQLGTFGGGINPSATGGGGVFDYTGNLGAAA